MPNNQFTVNLDATGGIVTQPFVIRMGLMTGEVIDHMQTYPSPPFSRVIDLDDGLESLAAIKGQRWWDCSRPADPREMTEFRARIVEHCVFFLNRMYLHLPCILKPQSSHLYSGSRKTGLESARQLIRRYHALRTPIGAPIFDCKTLDFIGFMASVILVLGTYQGSTTRTSLTSSDEELVNVTVSLLDKLDGEQNCSIAGQCHRCLTGLIALCSGDNFETNPSRIAIPYFGILHVTANAGTAKETPHLHAATAPSENMESYPAASIPGSLEPTTDTVETHLPTIDYQGLYSMDASMNWMMDANGPYAGSFGSMLDLDQDWEMFFYPD